MKRKEKCYAGFPRSTHGRPTKQLQGFTKLELMNGSYMDKIFRIGTRRSALFYGSVASVSINLPLFNTASKSTITATD